MQASQAWAASRPLAEAGVDLHFVGQRAGVRKMHHKLMVIDRAVTIAGSFNYTGPANRLNDESIVVLGAAGVLNKEARAGQAALGRAAAAEIRRLINEFGTAPSAESDALDQAS